MDKIKILWADDEIDLLKPHILFLEAKDYHVVTTNNGDEALDLIKSELFDIIFLDENMPGLSGLETLSQIKILHPNLPVIMITKSEEESIMEEAIGSNISDYLIKPVNPNQILLAIKKNLDNKKLISEKTTHSYQQVFGQIGMEINNNLDYNEWKEIYKKLIRWELQLEKSDDSGIIEVLKMQKSDANNLFSKFVERNYIDWLKGNSNDKPVLSHTLFKEKIFQKLNPNKPLFVIIIDNFRYDQWKSLQNVFENYFRIEEDDIFFSILPSTTQYSRNAIFSGMLPSEIERKYPKYWTNEDEEGTKNQFEEELLVELLKRYGKNIKHSYHKILNLSAGKKLIDSLPNLLDNDLNVIVYNFVDMLSHARTEMEIIRELADDEPAYRSLTNSWFNHSPLFEIIKYIAEKNADLIVTTDHGSVRTTNAVKVLGDKNTNTNLRYKFGRSLQYKQKEVFEVRNPADIFLPKTNISTSYIFCKENDYFVYPNNYAYYANFYKNTFQHGGISMEEVMIPCIYMKAK
ncbi:MAG: PglZ domain-containing protein [Saprospiraceae bacterium]|nr:PglZ domain-containing protein [Saprospiraceae bacterium]